MHSQRVSPISALYRVCMCSCYLKFYSFADRLFWFKFVPDTVLCHSCTRCLRSGSPAWCCTCTTTWRASRSATFVTGARWTLKRARRHGQQRLGVCTRITRNPPFPIHTIRHTIRSHARAYMRTHVELCTHIELHTHMNIPFLTAPRRGLSFLNIALLGTHASLSVCMRMCVRVVTVSDRCITRSRFALA